MKIDRSNPRHWFALLVSSLMVAVAILLRPVWPTRKRPLVLFYGHRLHGNLAAVRQALLDAGTESPEPLVLTLDPAQARTLAADGVSVVRLDRPQAVAALASAAALVADHGLHTMMPMLWLSNLKFFDVWHGIPFKGFDVNDFRIQHRFDEVWVSSPELRRLYVERFGFRPERVVATGYARTDRLVRDREAAPVHRRRLGLDPNRKLVLFAPTWAQDTQGRNIYPFGLDAATFVRGVAEVARCHGAVVGLRTHLNSGLPDPELLGQDVVGVASVDWPDTEALLLASDVLICDWSSIAFDFLLLDRPAIFLDVPAPFSKGLSLGQEHRYGQVVSGLADLEKALAQALDGQRLDIERVRQEQECRRLTRAVAYGGLDDGSAAVRCVARLRRAIG